MNPLFILGFATYAPYTYSLEEKIIDTREHHIDLFK